MKASFTSVTLCRGCKAFAQDAFPDHSRSPWVWAHFKGASKQRRIARRAYIRYATATCAARGIPLYINGVLQ